MSALRKPSVAAMIMLICIIIAVLLGRAGGMAASESNDSGVAEYVSEVVNKYSTVGAIQNAIAETEARNQEAQSSDSTAVTDENSHSRFGTISTLLIVVGVILVLKGLAGKK